MNIKKYRDITGLIQPKCEAQRIREWEKIWNMERSYKNKHYCVWVNFKNHYFKTARKAKLFYKKIVSLGYAKTRFYIIKKGGFDLKMSYEGLNRSKIRQIGETHIQRNLTKLRFNGQVFIDDLGE